VLVDGTYGKNDKGDITYQPRSKEEIDQIAALVRSAIGFDKQRGDQVEVVNLRFAETPSTPIAEPTGWFAALAFTKADIMRVIELVVMGVLGLVVLLLVVRPLVRRIITPEERTIMLPAATAAGTEMPLAAEMPSVPAPAPAVDVNVDLSQTSKMIDLAQVQGQVHAQSVQKVGEIADRNPRETVSIIRQWLHESSAT